MSAETYPERRSYTGEAMDRNAGGYSPCLAKVRTARWASDPKNKKGPAEAGPGTNALRKEIHRTNDRISESNQRTERP